MIFLHNFTWVTFTPLFCNTCNEMTLGSESSTCLAKRHLESHAVSFSFSVGPSSHNTLLAIEYLGHTGQYTVKYSR